MQALDQAGYGGAIVCFLAMLFLLYKKNSLWKQFAAFALFCLLLIPAGAGLDQLMNENSGKNPNSKKNMAELLKYDIKSINATSDKDINDWRKGELWQIIYTLNIKKDEPSDDELKRLADDIKDKDALTRNKFNSLVVYVHTPRSEKTSVPFAVMSYLANGSMDQSIRTKPGENRYKYRWIINRNT